MKTRCTLLVWMIVITTSGFAQTQLAKTIACEKGKTVKLHFDYPELIKISTWEGNDIQVNGIVSINEGENDDAFVIDTDNAGSTISIKGYIKNLDDLPQRVTIFRDGQKIVFKDKAELKKYQEENGKVFNQMNFGADLDIVLEIKIPRNVETHILSVYGMVEVKNFAGPLVAQSTYGGVDAALSEKAVGEITAETNYGEIFTNLETKFGGEGMQDRDFHTYVTAKPGTGPKYQLESQYGNVYIRKAVN
ncbi:MAG TPA: hypothetical protein VD927_03695 [Chryseosolibacter sp.]|nr:hypothetical protein [Chryseosolibacter sp.]